MHPPGIVSGVLDGIVVPPASSGGTPGGCGNAGAVMQKDKTMGLNRSGAGGPLPARSGSPALPVGGGPVIDPQAIERLRELDPTGQQGVLQRVLQAYETSLTRHLADIGTVATVADLDRLARAVHTLKSSSAAVGALAFSQHCADVEHQARSERRLPEPAELEALIHEGQQVLAAVGAMLTK